MKTLITNHFLASYTGSEVACLDLAQALRDAGHQVTLACFEQGEPLLSELQRQQLTPVALSSLAGQQFDLMWAHHFTTLDAALLELNITAHKIIFSSLSPYEALESPPLCSERVNLFLANSPETQTALLDMGLATEQVRLFANPVAEPFFAHQPKVVAESDMDSPVIKLALVSNHIPPELSAALSLLAEQGVEVTVFGLEGRRCLITAELLSEFNGIISIGRTVQYGLAMGLPVFCYDHFAGPGWLSEENVELAAAHNFAGRCTPQRQSPEQLVAAIVGGFNAAQQAAAALRSFARARYQLTEQLANVLQQVTLQLPTVPSPACYQAIALRQRQYLQQQAQQQAPLLYASLYGDSGQGFSERFSVQRPLVPPYQQVSLNIELCELGLPGRLQALRIDPINAPCVVQLQRITLVSHDQQRKDVTGRITSNALFCQEQDYYFMSYDAQWWLTLDDVLLTEWHCVEVEVELLAIEEAALVLCQEKVVLQQQQAVLQQAEQQQQYQQLMWQHDLQQQKAEHLNDALQKMRHHPIWRSLRALRQLRDRVLGMPSNNNQ